VPVFRFAAGCSWPSPINRRIGLTSPNMTRAVARRIAVTVPNKVTSGVVLKNPAAQPASLLPNAFDRNHTPIIIPTILRGASFVTALSPTGLRQSSPNSDTMYDTMSHHGLTRTASPD
jgi:hypothetical protein